MKRRAQFALILGLGFCGGYLVQHWDASDWALADEENAPAWTPDLSGDVNSDGLLNIADALFILNYLFKGGPEPAPLPSRRTSKGIVQTGQQTCHDGVTGKEPFICTEPGELDHGQDPQFKHFGIAHDFEVVKPDPEDPATWYTIDFGTGLMWQYVADTTLRNWRDALAFISELEHGGFDDWRMPNINELSSIININRRNPSAYTDYFDIFTGTYWSSSTCIFDLSRAWIVNFTWGFTACPDKGGQGQNSFKLRSLAVRNLE